MGVLAGLASPLMGVLTGAYIFALKQALAHWDTSSAHRPLGV